MPDDRQPSDESRAEDVLAALAGRECEYDGGLLDPQTGQCEEECHTHCRWLCGDCYCGHQFISWNDDNGYDGPDVPVPPSWLGPVAEWSDVQKEAAFGDLQALAVYYDEIEEGQLPSSSAFDIACLLCKKLTVTTHAETWMQTQSMAGGCGSVVYAEDPGQARTELIAALNGLRQRFGQLALAESGIMDIQAEEALAILADLECPTCCLPIGGPRPWYCSACRTAVCVTCGAVPTGARRRPPGNEPILRTAISNVAPCAHLLLTEGRPGWDGDRCVACGDALQGWQCARCLSVHCPFCGVRSWAWRGSSWMVGETTCPHLIASWDGSGGEWWDAPDIGLDRLEGLTGADFADEAVRNVFGELADLAEEIAVVQRAPGEIGPLAALMRHLKRPSITDVFWDDQNGMSSDTGTDYFAADPVAAVDALRDLADRLVACRERLDAPRAAPH